MREAYLRKRLREQCTAAYLIGVSDRVHPGRPDFLWLRKYDKAVGWLELKTDSKLSKAQEAFLDVWVAKGGRAGVLSFKRPYLALTNWPDKQVHKYAPGEPWPNLIFDRM